MTSPPIACAEVESPASIGAEVEPYCVEVPYSKAAWVRRPFGVTDIDMPATPERVWRALQGKDMTRATAGTVSYGGTSTGSTGGAASPETISDNGSVL